MRPSSTFFPICLFLATPQMVNRGSTAAAQQLEGLHTSEVLSMLRFGADRIFRNEAGALPSEEQLDAIMDRCASIVFVGMWVGGVG